MGKSTKDKTVIPIRVTGPFDQIGINFVGPLKESKKGNKYIIVATNYLIKWPEAKPVKAAKAKKVANFLYEKIICRHGAPLSLISDHGTAFLERVVGLLKEE